MDPAPEKQLTSAILRCRDLGLDPGRTIELHSQLIKEKGETWWGWWANRNERAVDAALRTLIGLANNKLNVFLYDSGHAPDGQLYRERCRDIEWDDKNPEPGPILSPDPDLTPGYYAKIS